MSTQRVSVLLLTLCLVLPLGRLAMISDPLELPRSPPKEIAETKLAMGPLVDPAGARLARQLAANPLNPPPEESNAIRPT